MGLFLYLGTSALKGNQMFARSLELAGAPFLDADAAAARPNRPWAAASEAKTRAFTAVQLACLGGMMTLKSSPFGVLFPVIIAALGPLRFLMVKSGAYTEADMAALDAD